jgi:glutathione S-transferase
VLTLYQAEWCPHSRRVRQRLTELGLDFVARQVPAEKEDRDELERATGQRSIPTLVGDDGTALTGDEEILPWLDAHHDERPDASRHREKLLDEADESDPRNW